MKILLTGGGTMGSVSPLLAIKESLQTAMPDVVFLWIGTKNGPEKEIIEEAKIEYKSITSGKLRRYFDWHNFTDLILIFFGFLKSLWLIWRFKPDIILTAGSYVSVPVVWAGAFFKKRIIIHQQDLRIGLANKLMQKFAIRITVAFEELRDKFPKDKVVVTGNPVRQFLFKADKESALRKFNFSPHKPVILIMGGGLGSEIFNQTFIDVSKQLTEFCQVIHLTGKAEQAKWSHHALVAGNTSYQAFEFLTDDLAPAYAAADLVVSRAGLSALTEIAALHKPAIIIPIPKHQQIENAEFFHQKQAIVYVRQEDFTGEYIVALIKDLLEKPQRLQQLSQNISTVMPSNANEEYVRLIRELVI